MGSRCAARFGASGDGATAGDRGQAAVADVPARVAPFTAGLGANGKGFDPAGTRCRFASTGEISPSGETSSVAVGRVSGATGESSPRSRRSSSPASMSHAVAIVKARGDGTREKREFDNRRQVARPRVRAREIRGEREETRRGAKRFPRCGRFVFGCICHPTRPRTDPRFTVRSGRKNLFSGSRRFRCFLSPDRRSQRRDRDTPRHGPAFRFRPWLERSRFTAASRPPHPPSSPRRCVRRAVPPSRPTPPRKRELRPQQGRPRWPRPARDPHERRRAPG